MKNSRFIAVLVKIVSVFTIITICSACASKQVQKKSNKEIAQLYTELGTSALLRGDFSQAVSDLKRALGLNSNNAIAHNHLGLAYLSLNQPALAEQEFKNAISDDPNYSDAYINLGALATSGDNNKLAREFYQKALSNLEYRYRHRALTNLAQIEILEHNEKRARELLYQSLSANPDYCLTHFLLGTLYMREGESGKAADSFKKSVAKTCVGNPEGHYQLGVAYMRSKQYSKAKSQFVFLIQEFPQSKQAQRAGEQLKNIP